MCHGTGPLLLLAGPGAGKTRTLIHRIARLLETGRAAPWQILAVTFSVRAAGELRLRLADLLGENAASGITAATFHSVCARMLREHAPLAGRTDSYTIYDQAEVRKVIEWLLSDSQRGDIQHALATHGRPAASEVHNEISLAKARLLTPDSYEQSARHAAAPLIAQVWRQVDIELQRCNALGFDDLLVLAVRLLGEHPHIATLYRQKWQWLLVDEFQDTNEAQAVLVALLAGPNGNVCCVGDDDQGVYRWRGAEPGNMLEFHKRFPQCRRIVLGRNFRSRAEILEPAARCVAHNARRWPKALIAMRGAGGQARVLAFPTERDEAFWAADTIQRALRQSVPPTEVLVLARTGYATDPAQRALAQAGIPHRVLGSLGLYERAEVRDALAYLALLSNPCDAQAFRRAISAPKRGIGPAAANHVIQTAREQHNGDLIEACANGWKLEGIRAQNARGALARFGDGLRQARQELQAGRSTGHVVLVVLMIAGGPVHEQQHRRNHHPDAEQRQDAERVLEDLRSLARAANTYSEQNPSGSLTGFLEQACGLHAQQLEPGQPDRRITISTIHRAKGTEARVVILLGCEERLLPSWRAIESNDPEALCEERRLFYVGCTRAKNVLLISHVARRGRRPTAGPSRFLTEAGLTATEALAA